MVFDKNLYIIKYCKLMPYNTIKTTGSSTGTALAKAIPATLRKGRQKRSEGWALPPFIRLFLLIQMEPSGSFVL